MAENKGVVVVGSTNYDLITYTERLPRIGETIMGQDFQMGCGGKGANQAVQAAKLGARCSMIGKTGEDMFAEHMRKQFNSIGLETTYLLSTADSPTGVAPISVDANGSNSIVVVPGANSLLTPNDVRNSVDAIKNARVMLCQMEILPETTKEALIMAKEEGVVSVFNTAPASDLNAIRMLIPFATVVCSNENELAAITGVDVKIIEESIEEATRAAKMMLDLGCKKVIVTLGSNGCLVVTDDEATHVPVPKVQAIDTTGAGDSFLGAFAYFTCKNLSISEACANASKVASVSVLSRGTQSSYPSMENMVKNYNRDRKSTR
eukprot:TRINITY_DN1486_c0_g1_i2.p1 TRINITY_DN1486_c0_g1~~TRINITY_DN1486_c0_g1_i2.p1  ORF type:complete len:320 (+),score=60.66 TRINITY_DN1486_c0_g1_i2:68-1027(+)